MAAFSHLASLLAGAAKPQSAGRRAAVSEMASYFDEHDCEPSDPEREARTNILLEIARWMRGAGGAGPVGAGWGGRVTWGGRVWGRTHGCPGVSPEARFEGKSVLRRGRRPPGEGVSGRRAGGLGAVRRRGGGRGSRGGVAG